jgi:hypothetical protein
VANYSAVALKSGVFARQKLQISNRAKYRAIAKK